MIRILRHIHSRPNIEVLLCKAVIWLVIIAAWLAAILAIAHAWPS